MSDGVKQRVEISARTIRDDWESGEDTKRAGIMTENDRRDAR